jgi:hypothetical protein
MEWNPKWLSVGIFSIQRKFRKFMPGLPAKYDENFAKADAAGLIP